MLQQPAVTKCWSVRAQVLFVTFCWAMMLQYCTLCMTMMLQQPTVTLSLAVILRATLCHGIISKGCDSLPFHDFSKSHCEFVLGTEVTKPSFYTMSGYDFLIILYDSLLSLDVTRSFCDTAAL